MIDRRRRPVGHTSADRGVAGRVVAGRVLPGASVAGVVLAGALLAAGCNAGSRTTSSATTAPVTARADPATFVGSAADEGSATTVEAGGTQASRPSGADAAAQPACALLTEDDVVSAVGEPVQPGLQRSDECWWSTANDLKTVNLIIRTEDPEDWRSGYRNSSWEPVDLGDEGYEGKMLDSVVFRVGGTEYEVNVVYSTRGDARAVARRLATTIASRV